MGGIRAFFYSQMAIIRVPAGAPPQLRSGCRALFAAAAVLLALAASGPWLLPAAAQRIVLAAFAVSAAGTVSCWANAVRYDAERQERDAERRATARYLAELAGDPEPTPSRLHVA